MAVPKVTKEKIYEAIRYIDEHGVPAHNMSTKYELIVDGGKKYPPKYVLAVAEHLTSGNAITTDGFNAVEAVRYLRKLDFVIKPDFVKYVLTITADDVTSTDDDFSIDNLGAGDGYKPIDAYMMNNSGVEVKRNRIKNEREISNQTLPRIAFQVYEKQIIALSEEEKTNFPICKYTLDGNILRVIFNSVAEYRQHINTLEYMVYARTDGETFVIYCWNIFSTILFVQECLKRFGNPGDKFVLVYREKDEKESKLSVNEEMIEEELGQKSAGYKNPYSATLIQSKNIIFRGAPGTGKSYLAKEIAADIISDGQHMNYGDLSEEQKKQVEFVQFHPCYDYSDFVEGLRPKMNEDGTMGFELQDGIFKRFVSRARKNYENAGKSVEAISKELLVQDALAEFFDDMEYGKEEFTTITGNAFYVTGVDEEHIYISIPGNETVKKLTLQLDEIRKMLESGQEFAKVRDITKFFGKQFSAQGYSYDFVLFKAIKERVKTLKKANFNQIEEVKKYIFIIDEINRGEISKILGELFFSIDPGYRGKKGEGSTQYSNMHPDPEDKFYIPENVYIIGTMNDIDRSVDSFDFAMRRRFRFIEIKANDRIEMLRQLDDEEKEKEAIKRMKALNEAILKVDDLNVNYQIGASYFLKLNHMSFEELWTDCLQPLLQDYVQGMYDEKTIMDNLAKAYGYNVSEGEEE